MPPALRPFHAAAPCLRSAALIALFCAACGDGGSEPSATDSGPSGTVADAAAGGGADAAPSTDAGSPGDAGTSKGGPFDAGTDPNRNTVTADGLCDRFATLQCAAEQSCCTQPGRAFDACKATQLQICRTQGHIDDAAKVPQAGFDAARAKSAFEAFETLAARCDAGIASWVLEVSGFRGVFTGTLAAKASCLPPTDVILNADEGKAAGWALACSNPDSTACLPMNAFTWTCEPRGGAGSACFTDANCSGATYCDNPNPGIGSLGAGTTCKPRKDIGADCVGTGECTSLVCVAKKCASPTADGAYCLGR